MFRDHHQGFPARGILCHLVGCSPVWDCSYCGRESWQYVNDADATERRENLGSCWPTSKCAVLPSLKRWDEAFHSNATSPRSSDHAILPGQAIRLPGPSNQQHSTKPLETG